MNDCKTCAHATALYLREREDRHSNTFLPSGYVRCGGPRYKGRRFFRRDTCRNCPDYVKKERGA